MHFRNKRCRFRVMDDTPTKKRRRRFKQTVPLGERLIQRAELARQQAAQLPPGKERHDLLKKAQQAEVVAELETSLSTSTVATATPPNEFGAESERWRHREIALLRRREK
jgi:hypothetical protein